MDCLWLHYIDSNRSNELCVYSATSYKIPTFFNSRSFSHTIYTHTHTLRKQCIYNGEGSPVRIKYWKLSAVAIALNIHHIMNWRVFVCVCSFIMAIVLVARKSMAIFFVFAKNGVCNVWIGWWNSIPVRWAMKYFFLYIVYS